MKTRSFKRAGVLTVLALVAQVLVVPLGRADGTAPFAVCDLPGIDDRCETWTAIYDDPSVATGSYQLEPRLAASADGSRVFVSAINQHKNPADPSCSPASWTVLGYDGVTGAERWQQSFSGPGNYDRPNAITASRDGSVVVATGGSYDAPVLCATDRDLMTIAYDGSSGDELWRAHSPGPVRDVGSDVLFSADERQVFVIVNDNAGGGDIDWAVAAYEVTTGQELWRTPYRGLGLGKVDSPKAAALSLAGDLLYVSGQSGGAREFDIDYATVAYATSGAEAGSVVWEARYDGGKELSDRVDDLAVDVDGRVIVTGDTLLNNDFGQVDLDYATVAYDGTTGEQLWESLYAGPAEKGFDFGRTVATSPVGRVAIVSGQSEGDDRDYDWATIAYDTRTGAELWSRRLSTPNHKLELASDIAVTPDGTTGVVTGISGGTNATNFRDLNRSNGVTVGYAMEDGELMWSARLTGDDETDSFSPRRVLIADDGSAFVAGQLTNNMQTDESDNLYDAMVVAYRADTAAPTPSPTPTPTDPTGDGTTYYFHSATGIGNADRAVDGSTFDTAAPTFTGAATFHDLPPTNGAPQAIHDPYWTGSVSDAIRRFDIRFWQRSPLGDALAQVDWDVSIWVGDTQYRLPLVTRQVPPTIGNATNLIEATFTTMLDEAGNEVALDIDPAGQPVTISIAGHFIDSQAGAYIHYDSVGKPAGFTVNARVVDPDPTGSPTPSPPTPTPTPTQDVGERGSYPVVPNDPYFGVDPTGPTDFRPTQWALRKIQGPQAWQEPRATGFGIRVAVLDTGVDLRHEDLQCPGKLDVGAGSDVVNNDSDPDDENGHGTHVAGIIGACTNNGIGIAGVAPDATIMPIRVLNENGEGTDQNLIDGINRATEAGANIINLSLGFGGASGLDVFDFAAVDDAIANAAAQGVVIVAAAGNDSFPLCEYPSLAQEIICVGATDSRDTKSWYSTFANKQMRGGPAVVAPGGSEPVFCDIHSENILSLYPPAKDRCDEGLAGYRGLNGTSMAAPHVSGVAALVYDRLGGERSLENAQKMIDALTSTAVDLGPPGFDPVYGSGRVDALAAIQSIPAVDPDPTPTPTPTESGSPSPSPSESPEPDISDVSFTEDSAESGQHSDETLFEARLSDSSGEPIAGEELNFELRGSESTRSFTATTNGDGVASVTPSLEEKPGPHWLTVRFAGDERHAGDADTASFIVDKEDSALDLSVHGEDDEKTLTARLSDLDTSSEGIAERTIDFYSDGELIGSAKTDANGVASVPLPPRHRGNNRTYEAVFEGDDFYLAASDVSGGKGKGGNGGGGNGGGSGGRENSTNYGGKVLLM